MLCSFFDCPLTNFAEKKVLLYLDDTTWDKWEVVFNCYKLGTLMCSPNQPKDPNYKTNSLNSLVSSSFRPLQGLTAEEMCSVADKLLDGTVWFSIPMNHPTNAIKMKDYCSQLKTKRTILEAMVTYCKSHDKNLNDKILTISNILEHYGITDIIFANFCKTMEGCKYVKGSRNTKIESLSPQACVVLDRIIDASTDIQEIENSFEFGCHYGGPSLLSTLLHSFPSQFQPMLYTDFVVLDTLALKDESFLKDHYIELFRFLIEKNGLKDFTMIILVEIWSCKDVRQALEIVVKDSNVNYKMATGLYEYKEQNNYSYDIVLTIHFYSEESKSLEASRYSHTFRDISDENERDFEFWEELLQMHQQHSDLNLIISLYAGTNLQKACCTYGRRMACVVENELQRTTMLTNQESFQLQKPMSNILLLEYPGIVLVLFFL